MLVGLCTLAVVVLVTVVATIPEPAPAGLRGRSRSGRSRRPRHFRAHRRRLARPPREPRVVVRRRWRRRSPVPQIVLTFDPGATGPDEPGGLDPRTLRPAETTPVVRPASPPPGDLDLSGFDRLPRILGPARLSELQPGSDEWRW